MRPPYYEVSVTANAETKRDPWRPRKAALVKAWPLAKTELERDAVFVLFGVEERPYREIAVCHGVTPGAVWKATQRMAARLKWPLPLPRKRRGRPTLVEPGAHNLSRSNVSHAVNQPGVER